MPKSLEREFRALGYEGYEGRRHLVLKHPQTGDMVVLARGRTASKTLKMTLKKLRMLQESRV